MVQRVDIKRHEYSWESRWTISNTRFQHRFAKLHFNEDLLNQFFEFLCIFAQIDKLILTFPQISYIVVPPQIHWCIVWSVNSRYYGEKWLNDCEFLHIFKYKFDFYLLESLEMNLLIFTVMHQLWTNSNVWYHHLVGTIKQKRKGILGKLFCSIKWLQILQTHYWFTNWYTTVKDFIKWILLKIYSGWNFSNLRRRHHMTSWFRHLITNSLISHLISRFETHPTF